MTTPAKVLLLSLLAVASNAIARDAAPAPASQIGVGAQYDTTHVYVAPEDVDRSSKAFSRPSEVRAPSRSSPP